MLKSYAVLMLMVLFILIIGCSDSKKTLTKVTFEENLTPEFNPLTSDTGLTGRWIGSFSFTNNCPDPVCRYRGIVEPHSVVLDLKETEDLFQDLSKVSIQFEVDYTRFKPELMDGTDGKEFCPSVKELGIMKGGFDNVIINASEFWFVDLFDNFWELEIKGDVIEGVISNDDPDCLGIESNDIELRKATK